MPRINLLPWREELRKRRRNQFYIGLGGAAAAGALVVLSSNLVMNAIISNQQERNDTLKAEIHFGYKPQDIVRASNGVTIQVIHTDAEGRMALG